MEIQKVFNRQLGAQEKDLHQGLKPESKQPASS